MEVPIGTQWMSLARIVMAGVLVVLVPMVSGAQQGTRGPFTTKEALITAPFHLSSAMSTPIGADSFEVPQKSVTTVFDDGFEAGIPDSLDVSGDGDVFWGDTDFRSHLGSRSAWCAGGGANGQPDGGDYVNNMNSWMIFGPFSLSDAEAGSMTFWLWNESELYNDPVMWGVSLDGGSFGVVQLTGTTDAWEEQTVDFTDAPALGDVTGQSNVWVAFVFRSDGSITGPGAYIDDVRIEKTTATGGANAVACTSDFVYWNEIAAHNEGSAGSVWRTDVVACNPNEQDAMLEFILHRDSGLARIDGEVDAMAQGVFEDIVGMMDVEGKGALEICSSQPLEIVARIYSQSAEGTFGQFLDGINYSGMDEGDTARLLGLCQRGNEFRTNINVTNTGMETAVVEITLFGTDGSELTFYQLELGSGRAVQDLEPFRTRANSANVGWGFADVAVVSGGGVIVSASVIDSRTNDATTIPMKR